MKFFKKALIATAILGSVGAQAATVSSTALKLSAEGVMYKTPVTAQKLTFDIVVDKDHPSASTITLAFDSNVDLTSALSCGGSVIQGVSGGVAACGDIGFNYGTGSFTFDNLVIVDGDATKGETDSISFDVNLGNPLYANSAFRIVIGDHGFESDANISVAGVDAVLVKGASVLAYSSEDAADVAIETGTGVIATEVSQYSYAVKTELDGVIERSAGLQFISGTTGTSDTFAYVLTNNLGLGLAITGADTAVTLDGNFEDVSNFTTTTATVGSTVWSTSTGATETDTGTVTLTAAEHAAAATTGTSAYALTPVVTVAVDGTTEIPVTGSVPSKAVVLDTSGNNATVAFPVGGIVIASNVDAGEWVLDATIINVPYFPINYTATSSSVHIANEGKKDADVIVTAIDNNGTEYGPLNLGFDANGNTVTKVSQGAIATLFGITDPTKLSVTFNIDADEEDVSAHAFSQNEKGRSEVSNSQLKGK